MEIRNFRRYRDGGTNEIETDEGVFCFDERIHSSTKGRLYLGYPKNDMSNLIHDSIELEKRLIASLLNYKDSFNQISIDSLIETKQKEFGR